MKKIFLLPLFTLLIAGTTTFFNRERVEIKAATPMPTNINMTINSDAQVSSYYSGVEGKTGDTLLAFLYSKIRDHNEYDYENNTHRFIYKIIDRNWELDAIDPRGSANTTNFDYTNDNGFIRKIYADYNDDINTADRFKNDGASRVSFDKEHIWPQSLGEFGRTGGAGSDFHSLLPADVSGNQNAHSNYSYGVPTSGITDYLNDKGTYVGRNGYISGSPNKVFEPLNEFKGDVARAMFYMPARYYEYIDALHPKLELVNQSLLGHTASTTVTGKAGILNTLLEWNELDPVDEYEIRRNNLIANNYQMNRNPFIDYPQWARISYDPNYTGPGASNVLESSSVGTGELMTGIALTGITLDTTNVVKNFILNSNFSSQDLVVTAHYENGVSKPTQSYTINPAKGSLLTTSGIKQVVVSVTHEGVTKTASYDINVSAGQISDYLFISEFYGGGGNASSVYKHDFVELYNHHTEPLNLSGKSVFYASATSATYLSTSVQLSGIVAPKSFFLVRLSAGTGGTIDTPQGDNSGTILAGAINFKVALYNSNTIPPTIDTTDPLLIDFVGAGTATHFYEAAAPAGSNTNSIHRTFIKDNVNPPITKNNSVDYISGTPTPTNQALSIAVDIMKGNTIDQCITLYAPFKERVLNLTADIVDEETGIITPGQLSYFKNGTETRMVEGRNRYVAWAINQGDHSPYALSNFGSIGEEIKTARPNYGVIIILFFVIFATPLILQKRRISSK